jgi:hypothetical protein
MIGLKDIGKAIINGRLSPLYTPMLAVLAVICFAIGMHRGQLTLTWKLAQ